MSSRVLLYDSDIRMAIFFLTNLATILEYMQQRIYDDKGIDYYKKKMD